MVLPFWFYLFGSRDSAPVPPLIQLSPVLGDEALWVLCLLDGGSPLGFQAHCALFDIALFLRGRLFIFFLLPFVSHHTWVCVDCLGLGMLRMSRSAILFCFLVLLVFHIARLLASCRYALLRVMAYLPMIGHFACFSLCFSAFSVLDVLMGLHSVSISYCYSMVSPWFLVGAVWVVFINLPVRLHVLTEPSFTSRWITC